MAILSYSRPASSAGKLGTKYFDNSGRLKEFVDAVEHWLKVPIDKYIYCKDVAKSKEFQFEIKSLNITKLSEDLISERKCKKAKKSQISPPLSSKKGFHDINTEGI